MYAITDSDGVLIDVVEADVREAMRTARMMGAAEVVYDDSLDFLQAFPKAVAANPRDLDKLDPDRAPQAAWRACGKLSMPLNEVLDVSLRESHRLLYPYFSRLRLTETGEEPSHWRSPLGMATELLRQNAKTAKSHPHGATDVQGLSLLPKTYWSKKLGGEQWIGHRVDFCVGASEWCEQACLVYSGRQQLDVYNTELKEATVDALVAQPVAFGRMLYEACRKQQGTSAGRFQPKFVSQGVRGDRDVIPFVRLNVLSDVPWELVFPGLFELLPGLSFYDYTKVPGRQRLENFPSNYDITFSYSGANHQSSMDVLNAGGKLAVVFFKRTQKSKSMRWKTHGAWRLGKGDFPKTLFGAEVLDGDISDVRPFDFMLAKGPPPWVIGLRYKTPIGHAFDPANALFVVPCWELDGEIVTVEVPRDTPGTLEAVMRSADDEMRAHLASAEAAEASRRPQKVVPISRLGRKKRR